MKYKAISIVSPSGTKIANREKTIEVRKWKPPITPLMNLLIVQNENYLSTENPSDKNGETVALVDVLNVTKWKEEHLQNSCASYFEEGYFAWHLTNIRKVQSKSKVTAHRKIYLAEVNLIFQDNT